MIWLPFVCASMSTAGGKCGGGRRAGKGEQKGKSLSNKLIGNVKALSLTLSRYSIVSVPVFLLLIDFAYSILSNCFPISCSIRAKVNIKHFIATRSAG